MDDITFNNLVAAGLEAIPLEYREKLDNVAIVSQDEPSFEQLNKMRIRRGWTLYGLYEGIPITKRNSSYSGVLPDKITIFKNPILRSAKDEEDVKEMVKHTVWHEIAHHFGMDEERVRNAEKARRERKLITND